MAGMLKMMESWRQGTSEESTSIGKDPFHLLPGKEGGWERCLRRLRRKVGRKHILSAPFQLCGCGRRYRLQIQSPGLPGQGGF